ncbi:DUF1178 family protein [Flexibacterium corallicola]|uniref:DUF1178 family protein n=1 Tax=Flexibacterium corallicola TaxID=3037259 RepID=UPI00286F46AF|nr:DUF1178 family protein [Pseudovibrio sp. M1P-2-3]
MINYSLCCDNGHEFDGWFRNSSDFDRQLAMELVTCPVCDSSVVTKRLMAPNVSTSRTKTKAQKEQQLRTQAEKAAVDAVKPPSPAPASPASGQEVVTQAVHQPKISNEVKEKAHEMVEALREFRKQATRNSEDVGKNFAEEARKMHYGESEKRNIHGSSSVDDAKDLIEEGIDVVPLPALPEDHN